MISNIIDDVLNPKDELISVKRERLRYCIELLISSMHETISELDEEIRPLFKLYMQEYENNNPKYDIGNGNSNDENSLFGNLNNLYPKRFDLYDVKSICSSDNLKNLSTALFYIPSFLILYDLENIELKVKFFWLNIDTDYNLDNNVYHLLQRQNAKWTVLEIVPKLEELKDENLNTKKIDSEIEEKIIFNEHLFELLNRINIFFKITSVNVKFLKTRRLIYD